MASDKSSQRNCQQRDVCNGIEVFGGVSVSDPQSFLRGSLEAGVVPLAFRSQSIDRLKRNGITLDRKSVVIWDRHIFRAACGFRPFMETIMSARTVVNMGGSLVGAAILLSGTPII